MGTSRTVELDALLAHEVWAIRLARALVGDDDEANEIVQRARIAFWRRPPRNAEQTRPWLRVVIRHLAHSAGRVRVRRAAILEAAARAEGQAPDAEHLARTLETHKLLADLVGALRDPYREVIVLRYYEGLTAAAIARRMNVPAGTVRWRLKSALEMLRARLDEREGGRKAWVGIVGGIAGRQPIERVQAPLLRPALLLGGTATIILLVHLASTQVPSALVVGPTGSGTKTTAGTSAPKQGTVPKRALALIGAGASTVTENAERTFPSWAEESVFPRREIAGRVVSAGRPVAGAELRLSSGALTHARALDRHVRTATDGKFSFSQQAPTNWFLTAAAPGLAPEILYVDLRRLAPLIKPRNDPPEDLVINLEPCRVLVRGTVRDAGGGAIAGARVKYTAAWNNGGVSVRSDERGSYELCVPPTPTGRDILTIVVETDGYGTVETRAAFSESQSFDFVLEPAAVVAGRVVRDGDGAPSPGVKVTLGPQPPANPNEPPIGRAQATRMETESDDEGRFEIGGLSAGTYRLQAVGETATAADNDHKIVVTAGSRMTDVEIRVAELALVEGVVRRGGVPAPGIVVYFSSRDIPDVPRGHHSLIPYAFTGPDGRFRARLRRGTIVDRVLGSWPGDRAPRGFVVDRAHVTGMTIDVPN